MYTLDECIKDLCKKHSIEHAEIFLHKLMQRYQNKTRLGPKYPEVLPILDSIRILNQSWKYSFLFDLARKECNNCHIIKDFSEFNLGKVRDSKCKTCKALKFREYYIKNKIDIVSRVTARSRNLDRVMTKEEIEFILQRDEYKCKFCNLSNEDHLINWGTRLHIDHVIPLSKGGLTTIENSQLLCVSCNSSKRDKVSVAQK